MKLSKNVFVIFCGIFIAAACTKVAPPINQTKTPDPQNKTEEVRVSDKKTDSKPNKTIGTGSYKEYSADTLATEQKAGQKVVLFFHAKWCSECRALDTEFKKQTHAIPEGVTILKLDFDSETSLKEKYGVVSQHTFVQVDDNLNMIAKWNIEDANILYKYIK